MTTADTIKQFITGLEQNFKPDQSINFNIKNMRYLKVLPCSAIITENNSYCEWVSKDKEWHFVAINSGNTKVSEVVSALKEFLPEHKDDMLAMWDNETWRTISSSNFETTTKFIFSDKPYALQHPKIIEHNNTFQYKAFWSKFISKMEAFSKIEDDSLSKLRFAQYLLIDQSMSDPKIDIPSPYFYADKFYQTEQEVKTAYPDIKDFKFRLNKNIFVSDEFFGQKLEVIQKPEYWIGKDSFSMADLLNKYTLSETQITKFFVEKDSKLECQHPDILQTFEK